MKWATNELIVVGSLGIQSYTHEQIPHLSLNITGLGIVISMLHVEWKSGNLQQLTKFEH